MLKKLFFLTTLISVALFSQPIDKSIKWFDVGSNQFKVQPIPFIPMDSTIAANVTTPVAGKGNIFIGLDRKMYAKWVGGTVTEIGGGGTSGANTSLSNLTSPTAINQDLNYRGGKSAIFWDAGNTSPMGIVNSSNLGRLDFVYDIGGGSQSTIMSVRPTEIFAASIFPFTNSVSDIGSPSLRYKDAYISGNITGTWNGNTVDVTKGGTGRTNLAVNALLVGQENFAVNTLSPGAANTFLQSNGEEWAARKIYYPANISATSDEVDVSITGLSATSVVYASWGKSVTGVPLGQLYVVSTNTNTCKIRSNADELYNHNIVVTVVQW